MDFIERLKEEYQIALNPQQEQAVRTVDGPVLLLAVPGSGKTTVLIARLANMIQNHGIQPQKILTMTFSRRSAEDMRQRYTRYFGDNAAPRFSTIHQFCYGVVRRISAEYRRPLPRLVEDPAELVRALYCQQENVRFVEREKLDELVNAIGYAKNRLMDEQQVARVQMEDCDFPRLYKAYRAHMKAQGLMDYDDMLLFTYEMFAKNPGFLARYQAAYSHICVDEAQDTSLVQHKVIAQLAEQSKNLFMVGDEDQSIYGFRGAYPDALLAFEREHPGAVVLKMEQNYRSTKEVVRAASRLIRQNSERIEKQMFSQREDGPAAAVHWIKKPSEQYQRVLELLKTRRPGWSCAVLYRNNESAIPLVDALAAAGLPFSLKDTREAFFHTAHMRDFTAFLRLALDPRDLESFTRIYSKTSAYYSRAVLDFVTQSHRPGDTVWKTLARCPAADSGRTMVLQAQLERLKNQPPLGALNLLENIASRNYFYSEGASRRLTLLKSIAARQGTVADLLARLDELEGIVREAPPFGRGSVTLSTIHSCKGLEYDCVLLIDLIEGQFPSKACIDLLEEGDRSLYEEEVRLCYVAATRARNELHLVTFAEGSWLCKPSRFVKLLTVDPPKLPKKEKKLTKAPQPPKEIRGYTLVTDPASLVPGKLVLHDAFGEGRILRVEQGFLTWFDGVLTKRLSVEICLDNQNLFLPDGKEQ